jgi:hypothetical protein
MKVEVEIGTVPPWMEEDSWAEEDGYGWMTFRFRTDGPEGMRRQKTTKKE